MKTDQRAGSKYAHADYCADPFDDAHTRCPARKRGRPLGSTGARRGKARRVDPRWMPDYIKAIGRRIHDLRLERDVAVAELAAATGLGSSAILRLERGFVHRKREIEGKRIEAGVGTRITTVIRCALALGVSPREVMP